MSPPMTNSPSPNEDQAEALYAYVDEAKREASRELATSVTGGAGTPAPPTSEAELGFDVAGEGTPGCPNPDCGLYPHYGVAPHICYDLRGPEYTIGQSIGLPPSEWPANFVIELEPGETPETVAYPNACGIYYCPDCKAGMLDDGASSRPTGTDEAGPGMNSNPSVHP